MPSPFGHLLAGVTVAFAADVAERRRSTPVFVATCAGLAMAPDLDLVFPGQHRMWSHSVTATLLVTIVAAAVTGKVSRWRTAIVCGVAYGSHLLFDWLAVDGWPPYGVQMLWPFSHRYFVSGWNVFPQTARDGLFTVPVMRQNALAILQEFAILAPIVIGFWLVRRRRS